MKRGGCQQVWEKKRGDPHLTFCGEPGRSAPSSQCTAVTATFTATRRDNRRARAPIITSSPLFPFAHFPNASFLWFVALKKNSTPPGHLSLRRKAVVVSHQCLVIVNFVLLSVLAPPPQFGALSLFLHPFFPVVVGCRVRTIVHLDTLRREKEREREIENVHVRVWRGHEAAWGQSKVVPLWGVRLLLRPGPLHPESLLWVPPPFFCL